MRALFSCVLLASILACKPSFPDRPSQVSTVRVLAVQSNPPEAIPGGTSPITYNALVVDDSASGSPVFAQTPIDWAYCTEPKPLAEISDVAQACFDTVADCTADAGDAADGGAGDAGAATPCWILPITNTGLSGTSPLPQQGCNQFGPAPPTLADGENGRPADPDITGGYYQPLRLLVPNVDVTLPTTIKVLAKTRMFCGLAEASTDDKQGFNERYHLNSNPALQSIQAQWGSNQSQGVTALEDDPSASLTVPANTDINLYVGWNECRPTTLDPKTNTQVPQTCENLTCCGDGFCDATESSLAGTTDFCAADCAVPDANGIAQTLGCTGAEYYLYYDVVNLDLTVNREAITISWYSAFGSFRDDSDGVSASQTDTFVTNVFTTPSTSGTYFVWVVIQDDRGGASWKTLKLQIP